MAFSPEVRLKRYLCYTNEANVYYPGCRFFSKRYSLEHVPSLKELLEADKYDAVIELIETVHNEKKSCYPDALLFILAQMVKGDPVKVARPSTLQLAKKLCEKTEAFVTFMKFCLENAPKMGFGRTFKKFVRTWYTDKEILKLAEIVGEHKKIRGWTHGDFMRLGHVKSSEPAKAACFKFAVMGVDSMKKEFGEVEDAKKVVGYLTTVDTYRRNKDAVEVAAKIESYMLSINHINCELLKNKKVWMALLKQMPVVEVLYYFQHLSKNSLFRSGRAWDHTFVDTVVEALTRPFANRTGVTPSKVFVEHMKYVNAGTIKMELATKLKKPLKKPPIINSSLTQAFNTLMNFAFEGLKPFGKKIAIVIELSNEMLHRRCCNNRYVIAHEAAIFIAYYFTKIEPNVKVFTFNGTGMKPFSIDKDMSVKAAIDTYKVSSVPDPEGVKTKGDEQIMNWLKEHSGRGGGTSTEEIDIFMIFKSYIDNNSLHALVSPSFPPSKKMKFVVGDLCGLPKTTKPPDKKNLFVTSGFDVYLVEALSGYISDFF